MVFGGQIQGGAVGRGVCWGKERGWNGFKWNAIGLMGNKGRMKRKKCVDGTNLLMGLRVGVS